MCLRKGMMCLAVGALVVAAGWARADEAASSSSLALDQPRYLQASEPATTEAAPEAATPGLLMSTLQLFGVGQPLEKANINVYGWVEGSYTWNFTEPTGGFNSFRSFDVYKDKGVLDQIDLTVERPVDVTQKKWDVGGRVDVMWGSDASFIHSNGLFDWYDAFNEPQNQWDLPQAYFDVAVPVGNGLRVRGGKFVALAGYETVDPRTNAFFSHSYIFTFAEPVSHTGVLGTYAFTDQWAVDVGVARGWNQSIEDNNDAAEFLGRVSYTPTKQWAFYLTLSEGPQNADNNSDYRTLVDFIASYAATDKLTLAVNGDYNYDAIDDGVQWYGVAGYAGYKVSEVFTPNLRVEWFRDNDGFATGTTANLYEATAGVTIRPVPNHQFLRNLIVRPELRYDWADQAVFDGGNWDQLTAAVDAVFSY